MASDYQSSDGERNEVQEAIPEETSELSSTGSDQEEGEVEFEENDGQDAFRQSIDGINIEEQELGESPATNGKRVQIQAESKSPMVGRD